MDFTTKLKFELNNEPYKHTRIYKIGYCEGLANLYNFINNSNSNIKPNEILVYITDEMTKKGATKMTYEII